MIIAPYFPMENLLNISIHFHVCAQFAYRIFMLCFFFLSSALRRLWDGGITAFSFLVEKRQVAAGGTQC